ncbi:MAG: tRNA (N6-threonylcarbamoyladenosine(37)-N6)-methyltransferase TrmO [Lachnospiraceae bacterium]|nr:tRNA (N6-threonylcarbamoyladenosine(37)-N6)-methyltransferase TrmO [Lachnospiraceae bacterium]
MEINPIAYIHTDFPAKFGIPRQAGIVPELTGTITFLPQYSQPEAVRGLTGFSHIWILWDFSLEHHENYNLTVRPPRLGGKESVGVFASRSPFRPNSIGLSSVRLTDIEYTEKGPVLHVSGVDMVDGTPVYDIKPYIPYDDCHPEAKGGYTDEITWEALDVSDPEDLIEKTGLSCLQKQALMKVLSQDPRSRFDSRSDGSRRYGFFFADYDVRFTVTGINLTITEIVRRIQ